MRKFLLASALIGWCGSAMALDLDTDPEAGERLVDRTDCTKVMQVVASYATGPRGKQSVVNLVMVTEWEFGRLFDGQQPFESHDSEGPNLEAGVNHFCLEHPYANLRQAIQWYGDNYGVKR